MARMDLIKRSIAGDPNAFEMIFEQYKNLVFKTAYLMLDDYDEAEDALQEIFLKVYGALGTYNPAKGAFSTWLYRITVNHCLNQKRKLFHIFKSMRVSNDQKLQVHTSIEDKLAENQAIDQALSRLSDKLRVVIILRYFLDLSYSEIAQVLDLPLGTVKSRLNMGLKKVRDGLEEEELKGLPTREVSK
ncbi:MAG: sigma-70 family RNA polymerase sigma factor [Anaerolineales bacterium]|nr:sigma-70 family RNA polymerase sigma factor [Anaerolineales bacterium]